MASELISQYIARLPEVAGVSSLWRVAPSRVAGRFLDYELTSVFQPILRADGDVFGDTALVRCHGEQVDDPAPPQLFALAGSDGELVRLDRLCRTVHAINYFATAPDARTLLLKVDPRLLASVPDQHGTAFERVLTSLGVEPSRVVIEIPAMTNANPALVVHVVANYRHRGYRVAVHDDGNAAWHATLVHLRAEYVVTRVLQSTDAEALLPVVARANASGAQVLVTYLETEADVAAARAAGVDLLQGFALGRPGVQRQLSPES